MKKLIVLTLIMAGIVLMGGFSTPARAQSHEIKAKPTLMSPTPGLYVNGWPAFAVSYPEEWVELPGAGPGSVFQAGVQRPDLPPAPQLTILVFPAHLPLEDWAKIFIPVWIEFATDIKVLSDKPSQLKDGTPDREVELGWALKNAPKGNTLLLAAKKDLIWVAIILTDDRGKIAGPEKACLLPGPSAGRGGAGASVRAFLDMWRADSATSHDVTGIMAHFSDRFLDSGMIKGVMEKWYRNDPLSPLRRDDMPCQATVTVFELRGDKAYIDGFFLTKPKSDAKTLRTPMTNKQIISEHG